MFVDMSMRKKVLDEHQLDKWLENVIEWSPTMSIPNRRVWLSACGIPIHAWSKGTFKNITTIWGDLVQVDPRTLAPSSFERSRFQVEKDWVTQIDEHIDLQIEDKVFPIRVVEMEKVIGLKCDCCCGIDVGSTGEDTDVASSS
ncbi:hypothetical protein V6N11_001513 [Hibiscus sabdariffa]|uniref:DUF4283 domain-containing protein n=1 Tax=Hibiscus sabdariffa TaxID=183260 RepID=A0ABR2RZY7_9ROSI